MMTTHSLTFISNSSSKKSDYLRTNGMSERKRTNEMSEQEERLFAR